MATRSQAVKVVLAIVVGYCAMSGILGQVLDYSIGIGQVISADQEFLKNSLVSALGHFSALSVIKGVLFAINDSAFLGIAVGKIVSPFAETVHFLWKIFGYSMISITAQMGLLSFFKIIGLQVCFTAGAVLYVLSLGAVDLLKRIGIALMIIGLLFYCLMPYSIYFSKVMFEKSAQETNRQLEDSLIQFQNKAQQIEVFSFKNLWPATAKRTAANIQATLSSGIDTIIKAMIGYFTIIIIMFVITPLFFYGLAYLIIKKTLDCIGVPQLTVKIDETIIKNLKKL